MHPATRVTLRHLLMQNATSGGHPLDVTGSEAATIAQVVAMLDATSENVRDGLDTAMRVPGEPGSVVVGNVVSKVVEEQKRVDVIGVPEAKGALEFDAGTFERRHGRGDLLDRSNGHDESLSPILPADWSECLRTTGFATSCSLDSGGTHERIGLW